jgi:hypothetical protein
MSWECVSRCVGGVDGTGDERVALVVDGMRGMLCELASRRVVSWMLIYVSRDERGVGSPCGVVVSKWCEVFMST